MPAKTLLLLAAALQSMNPGDLLAHVKILASDRFEGRAPGTAGEDLTVAYLTKQFKEYGLKPGNPDGTFVQEVPLVAIKSAPVASFAPASGGAAYVPAYPDDYVAVSRHVAPEVDVKDSEMVFVGYGVVAPEYGWDDYKGMDLRGKTLVMLINDPPVPDPKDLSRLDEKVFKGKTMTYYGRWTYKYEIAAKEGAAAAIIVHETEPAGYPYEVIKNSWSGENSDLKTPDGNSGLVPVEAWVSSGTAVKLLALAGQDFAALKRQAVSRDFKPVALGLKASFAIKNEIREIRSRNVVAKLEGSDPKLKDEYVVYTAHWDHFGKNEKLHQIFHGALDNASGVAGLLELARAFTKLATPPKRSILFLAVTAEEQGLLGSRYYAANPLYPLNKTLAEINMDILNAWGRTKDIVAVGLGNTSLDDILEDAARASGRTVKPDPEPEKGGFYRSDHFEFAKKGVPALNYGIGTEYLNRPEGWGKKKRDEYTANDYHKPTDQVKPDWDFSGAVDDLRLFFQVGWRVAQADSYPAWKPGTEFKAAREASLAR